MTTGFQYEPFTAHAAYPSATVMLMAPWYPMFLFPPRRRVALLYIEYLSDFVDSVTRFVAGVSAPHGPVADEIASRF